MVKKVYKMCFSAVLLIFLPAQGSVPPTNISLQVTARRQFNNFLSRIATTSSNLLRDSLSATQEKVIKTSNFYSGCNIQSRIYFLVSISPYFSPLQTQPLKEYIKISSLDFLHHIFVGNVCPIQVNAKH